MHAKDIIGVQTIVNSLPETKVAHDEALFENCLEQHVSS